MSRQNALADFLLTLAGAPGALRWKTPPVEESLTETQARVAAFLIMALLLLLGFVLLRLLDYFRDRVRKFQPLLAVNDDSFDGAQWLAFFPWVVGVIVAINSGPNSGVASFALTALGILIFDRYLLDGQRGNMANLCFELAQAVRNRIALHHFFETAASEHYRSKRLRLVGARLRDGHALSTALRESGLFPPQAIVAIQAGESAGGTALERVLRNLAKTLKSENRLTTSLVTNTCIPLLSWMMAMGIAWWVCEFCLTRLYFLVWLLGPSYAPRATLQTYLMFAAAASLVFLGLLLIYCAYERVFAFGLTAKIVKRIVSRLPLLGPRYRHRCLARSCYALSAMTDSGVPLWTALRLVSDFDLSGPYGASFLALAEKIETGVPFASALKTSALPDSVTCLLLSGAAGGALPDAFAAAAEWHDSRGEKWDHLLNAVIPCLTVAFSGIVIGIVYGSVFWTMMQIREIVIVRAGLVH